MTQAKLAEALNVTYQTVSKWENNVNTPDISALEKICNVYGITVDEFLRMAEENAQADAETMPADENCVDGEPSVAKFCPECGTPLAARFCKKCGYDMVEKRTAGERESAVVASAKLCEEAPASDGDGAAPARKISKKKLAIIITASVLGAIAVILAIVLPIALTLGKKQNSSQTVPEKPVVEVTVCFVGGAEATGTMPDVTVMSDEKYLLPTCKFTRKGYVFECWKSGNVKYYPNGWIKFDGDATKVIFTAAWKPIEYTITIDTRVYPVVLYGEITVNEERTVDIKCKYGIDPFINLMPFASGLDLESYTVYDKNGNVYRGDMRYINDEPNAKLRAVLNWKSSTYDMVFCDISGFWNDWEEVYRIEFCQGYEEHIIPTYDEVFGEDHKPGYKFKRWAYQIDTDVYLYYNGGETVSNIKITELGKVIMGHAYFYAEWEPIEYTIKFDPNGGDGSIPDINCKGNETYTLPKNRFVKTGYAFGGWEYDGNVYFDGTEVFNLAADGCTVTFTARWIECFDGEGTEASPYIISDYDELNRMSEFARYAIGADKAYYALISDIDCGGKPLGAILGYGGDSFKGFFDGRNHVIRNAVFVSTDGLYYASASERKYCGLFGAVSGGRVSNVGIENYTMDLGSDINYAAPLCGFYGSHEPISNCYASGTISLENAYKNTLVVGGLVGYMSGGMSDCCASGSINMKYTQPSGEQWSGSNLYVAGFVARQNTGDVERCYADVDINFDIAPDIDIYDNFVCGLFYAEACRAFNCFASGSIHSNRYYTASDERTSFRYVDIFGSGYRPDSPLYISADSSVTFDDYPDWTKECEGVTQTANANLRSLDWLADNLTFDASVWEEVDGELPRLKAFGG